MKLQLHFKSNSVIRNKIYQQIIYATIPNENKRKCKKKLLGKLSIMKIIF